jgi:hypothetical protein
MCALSGIKSKKKITLFFILLLFITAGVNAQFGPPGGGGGRGGNNSDMMKLMKDIKGRVYGKILDARTKKPVEFASVVVLWYNKDSALAGGFTEANGDFSLDNLPAMGGFRLRVSIIGYKNYDTKFYIQAPNKLELDLGNIKLEVDEKVLKEIEVTAEKSTFQMTVDRKVYNVEKDLSVRGGTGVDVLKNIPSLTVDNDGNATLREKSVMLYIDGKPTTLTMQQIPADQIERVEVISNPGAKYEAAASGGIVNVVLKKNQKPGYNGMVMGNVGTGDRYGLTTSLNIKENPWNFSFVFSGNITNSNRTQGYTKNTTFNFNNPITGTKGSDYFSQENSLTNKNQFYFGRIGADYNINNRNTIGGGFAYVTGIMGFTDRQKFSNISPTGLEYSKGDRLNEQGSTFYNYTGQITYKKTFPEAGKELSVDVNYNENIAKNGFEFTNMNAVWLGNSFNYLPYSIQRNDGSTSGKQYVAQIDFTNPMSETRKFEAGGRFFLKNSNFKNYTTYNVFPSGDFVKDTAQSNNYEIDDMINAAYATYTGKTFWDIGYQAGMRFEQTYYVGRLTDKNVSFRYEYPKGGNNWLFTLFPSMYLSKKMGKHEVQFNLSRKIDRPNFFQSMPFIMFSDNRSYRIGNPALKPELINIGELNYNFQFEKGNWLTSAYTRYSQNPITNFQSPSPSDSNITVSTWVNAKDIWRYGYENTLRLNLHKNFNTTLNFDVFYVFLNGGKINNLPETNAEGWSYKGKAAFNFTLPWKLQLQVNGTYEAPKVILNGWTFNNYFMDVSLAKTINTKLILNLTLSDVFNTKRFGSDVTTDYISQEILRRREGRFLRFSVTYLFGKFDTSILKRFSRGNKQGNTTPNMGGQDGLE